MDGSRVAGVEVVEVLGCGRGDHLLFSVASGISMSEDPAFRFAYTDDGAPVTVHATDTDGRVFDATFPAGM